MLDPTKVTILTPGVNSQGVDQRLGNSGRDPHRVPRRPPRRDRPHRRLHRSRPLLRRHLQGQVGRAARKPLRVQAPLRLRGLARRGAARTRLPISPTAIATSPSKNSPTRCTRPWWSSTSPASSTPPATKTSIPSSPRRRPIRSCCATRPRRSASARWPAASPPSCWFPILPAFPCPCPASDSAARTAPSSAHPRHGRVRQTLPRFRT